MKKTKPDNYKIVLSTAGIDYKSEGETIDEALVNLNMTWDKIKAKGTIKVSHGVFSCEKLYGLIQLRRMFGNKIMRGMAAKHLALFLTESK